MIVVIRGKSYEAVPLASLGQEVLSLGQMARLEREVAASDATTATCLEEVLDIVRDLMGSENGRHPQRFFVTILFYWLTMNMAGDKITIDEAAEIRPGEVRYVTQPQDAESPGKLKGPGAKRSRSGRSASETPTAP